MDAALALAAEKPFDEVTVAEVARRAGVSHGLLFYYFADKWAIVTEALSQLLDALHDAQAPLAHEKSPKQQIAGLVRRHIEFASAHAVSYGALMHGAAMARPDVHALIADARRHGVEVVAGILGRDVPLTPLDDLELWSWLAALDLCTERVLTGGLDLDEAVDWATRRLLGPARR